MTTTSIRVECVQIEMRVKAMIIDLRNKRNDNNTSSNGQSNEAYPKGKAQLLAFPFTKGGKNIDNDQATAAILKRAKSLKW